MIPLAHHISWPPLGIALLLAMLTGWLNHLGEHVESVDNAGFTHDPDYFVENFDALTFDRDGRPQHSLKAARMTHYMDDDTTVLDNPLLRKIDPARPVTVSARRALLSADNRHLYFLGQVRVERPSTGGAASLILETEHLQVTPEARTMRSHEPVGVRQGRSHISADTIFVDERAGTLTMTGNVRGTYEPAR